MGDTKRRVGGLIRAEVGRREWVDFAKGAAIILIVAYHTTLFLNSIDMASAGTGRLKFVLELFPMPAFFLISGLFQSRVGSWSFADLWRRRLRQYLYLYVLWSVIRFLFYAVAPNVRSDGAGGAASDPLALLLILVWPISSYWFIYALFLFTVVVWLFRKAPPWVLLALAGVLSVLSSSGLLDARNVGINRMTEYLLFFVIGAYFHRRIYDTVEKVRPRSAIAIVLGFIAISAVIVIVPAVIRIPGVALVGQVAAVSAGFALAFYLVRLRPLSWINYIGVRTLNIYLVHIYVIALLVAPLALFPQLDAILPGRGLILITLLTTAVILLSIVITRYLTRISWLFVYPFRSRTKPAVPADGARPTRTPAEQVGDDPRG
ncbi:acyltransferase family protein [Microbacterium sp. NPDC019599]|uniref:acyltransferase family protein n=1 Tax=Microbacterium sp. NPDC019599 TaxID=3154690 RepID=UPI0033E04931